MISSNEITHLKRATCHVQFNETRVSKGLLTTAILTSYQDSYYVAALDVGGVPRQTDGSRKDQSLSLFLSVSSWFVIVWKMPVQRPTSSA